MALESMSTDSTGSLSELVSFVGEASEEVEGETLQEDLEFETTEDGSGGVAGDLQAEVTWDEKPRHDNDIVMSAELFQQIKDMAVRMEEAGTGYGPGRGAEENGDLWVVQGLNRFNNTNWRSITGKKPPTFHCSSLTNFFASWLFNLVNPYKGTGSMCSMRELIYSDSQVHECKSNKYGAFRGWGDHTFRVNTNGDTGKRWGGTGYKRKDGHRSGDMTILDPLELYNRKDDPNMPTIMFAAQSTKKTKREDEVLPSCGTLLHRSNYS
jgi:hypothetical protein